MNDPEVEPVHPRSRAGLLIPLGLGLAAAVATAQVLEASRPNLVARVALTTPLPAGHALTEADVRHVDVPASDPHADAMGVPWDLRHWAVGKPLAHDLPRGALVRWADFRTQPAAPELGDGEAALAVDLGNVAHDPSLIHLGSLLLFDVAEASTLGAAGEARRPTVKVGPLRVVGLPGEGKQVFLVAVPYPEPDDAPTALLRRAAARGSGGPEICGLLLLRREPEPPARGARP